MKITLSHQCRAIIKQRNLALIVFFATIPMTIVVGVSLAALLGEIVTLVCFGVGVMSTFALNVNLALYKWCPKCDWPEFLTWSSFYWPLDVKCKQCGLNLSEQANK